MTNISEDRWFLKIKEKVFDGFPSFCKKSMENNYIKNQTKLAKAFDGKHCAVTIKENGTSATYYTHGVNDSGICTRNYLLQPIITEKFLPYYFINKKYSILKKLNRFYKDLQITGEIVGPNINNNDRKLIEYDFKVFTIYDIKNKKYLGHDTVLAICKKLKIPMVETVTDQLFFNKNKHTPEFFKNMMKSLNYSNTDNKIEGVVIRPIIESYIGKTNNRLSMTVLNS